MSCKHCAYCCGKSGKHMSMKVFHKALEIVSSMGEDISIGGGEPTLHPHFWSILGQCLGNVSDEYGVWLATNGSKTDISLKLANMAKKGILAVCLSLDRWHDPIDPRVIQAFKENIHNSDRDAREIRNNTKLSNIGRAKLNRLGNDDICICDTPFICPNGDIKQCGCPNAPFIDNVLTCDMATVCKDIQSYFDPNSGSWCVNGERIEYKGEKVKEMA